MIVAGGPRRLAGLEINSRRPGQDAYDRLEQRRLDPLAAAVAMARFEREQNSLRRENSADQIADGDAGAGRPALDGPRHAHQTRHPLRDLIEAGEIAQRAGRAEARDRACNDARVARRERFVIEPESLHDAGAKVVDHHVGAVDEPHQDFAAFRRFDLEADTFLRSIGRKKEITVRALAVAAELAARIFDRLDLQDLRAVVAEDLRAERAGKVARQIDDFYPRQRGRLMFGHFGHLSSETSAAALRLRGDSHWKRMNDGIIIEHHP